MTDTWSVEFELGPALAWDGRASAGQEAPRWAGQWHRQQGAMSFLPALGHVGAALSVRTVEEMGVPGGTDGLSAAGAPRQPPGSPRDKREL